MAQAVVEIVDPQLFILNSLLNVLKRLSSLPVFLRHLTCDSFTYFFVGLSDEVRFSSMSSLPAYI